MQTRAQKNRKCCANPARKFLARFAREEDGVLVVFAVYVFIIIFMIGGIGIDLMRFERERSKLQNTLDRAVLAAADLDQEMPAYDVVVDYFTKAGLAEYLQSVTVDEGLGYRIVSGTVSADVQTQFMHMTGLDSLQANGASTAEERIDGVEISLVLDVSGSMNSNNRLPRLKVAARDFIDDMVDNTEDGKLSISIIPYATQVTMPEDFLDEFNVTRLHGHSNCVNFEAADFNETGISLADPLEQTMHFNVWHYDEGRKDEPPELVRSPVCEASSSRELIVLQKDADTLKTFISNMWGGGNTSIDIGMKWGSVLLDPSIQPVVDNMIADGRVHSDFAALPLEYDSTDSLKVIVLMTDGQNTSQYYVEDQFRAGNSDVWWNADEELYSVYDEARDEFYWPFDESWNDHPYGNAAGEPGDATLLSYANLWAYTSVAENMRENYRPWMGNSAAWDAWYYGVWDHVNWSTKDARTKQICDVAKAQNVIVFTIGFEAPTGGVTVLEDCASSPAHFFDVDGLEINEAFAAIASSIRKLRLTQ